MLDFAFLCQLSNDDTVSYMNPVCEPKHTCEQKCEYFSLITEAKHLDRLAPSGSLEFRRRLNTFLADALGSREEIPLEPLEPVFKRRYAICEKDLSQLDKRAVPLALIRELIAKHKLVIRRSEYPNWMGFVETYRNAIYA